MKQPARKCDRCGNPFVGTDQQSTKAGWMKLKLRFFGTGRASKTSPYTSNKSAAFDVCPKCLKSFWDWFNSGDQSVGVPL